MCQSCQTWPTKCVSPVRHDRQNVSVLSDMTDKMCQSCQTWPAKCVSPVRHDWQNVSVLSDMTSKMCQSCQTWPAKCVSPVRHDLQNLGRFCYGLTQDWYFANRKLMRTDIFFTRTTKTICNFANSVT